MTVVTSDDILLFITQKQQISQSIFHNENLFFLYIKDILQLSIYGCVM